MSASLEQANCAVIPGPLRAAPLWRARFGRWVTRADLSLDSKAAEQNQASMSTANRSFIEPRFTSTTGEFWRITSASWRRSSG